MSHDRELLERAAKAAGVTHLGMEQAGLRLPKNSHNQSWVAHWNPLTNEVDAFNLMVQLQMVVQPYCYFSARCQKPATATISGGGMIEDTTGRFPTYQESFEQYDPGTATRLAIVRAAAKIGESMK